MAANFNFSLLSGGSRTRKFTLLINGSPLNLTTFKAYMEVRATSAPSSTVAPLIAFGTTVLPTTVQTYVTSLGFSVYRTITLGADSSITIAIPSDATASFAPLAQAKYIYDLWLYDESTNPVDKSDILSGFFTIAPRVTEI